MTTLLPATGAIGARHIPGTAIAAGLLFLAGCAAPVAEAPSIPPRSPADRACVAALEQQNQTGGVTILGSDVSETGTRLLLRAPNAEQPWACEASNDGATIKLEYQGEG